MNNQSLFRNNVKVVGFMARRATATINEQEGTVSVQVTISSPKEDGKFSEILNVRMTDKEFLNMSRTVSPGDMVEMTVGLTNTLLTNPEDEDQKRSWLTAFLRNKFVDGKYAGPSYRVVWSRSIQMRKPPRSFQVEGKELLLNHNTPVPTEA